MVKTLLIYTALCCTPENIEYIETTAPEGKGMVVVTDSCDNEHKLIVDKSKVDSAKVLKWFDNLTNEKGCVK